MTLNSMTLTSPKAAAVYHEDSYLAEHSRKQQHSRTLACQIAKLAEDFRGRDTVVLELIGVTPIVDYFVITTGTNPRQMMALTDEVRKVLKVKGQPAWGVEGDSAGNWILQDYGDIVLHVFHPDARKLYDLEHLWSDAPQLDWKAIASGASLESVTV